LTVNLPFTATGDGSGVTAVMRMSRWLVVVVVWPKPTVTIGQASARHLAASARAAKRVPLSAPSLRTIRPRRFRSEA